MTGATSPFEMLIRCSDGRRSFVVSVDCAADSLDPSVSAAARPSAQVVILRTRIQITPPGALHAATLCRGIAAVLGILRAVAQIKDRRRFVWLRRLPGSSGSYAH